MAIVERAPETVADHLVDQLPVAEPVAIAAVLHQVGRAGHVLHAARDQAFGIAGTDGLRGERHCLEPAATDFVDGGRGNALCEPGADRRLACGVLTEAGLQHVAHEHLVDRIDPRAAQRLLDGNRSEPGRGHIGEGTPEGADRRSHGADDDGFFHADHSTLSSRTACPACRRTTPRSARGMWRDRIDDAAVRVAQRRMRRRASPSGPRPRAMRRRGNP